MDEKFLKMKESRIEKILLWMLLISTFSGITLNTINHSDGGDILKGLSDFKFFTLQSNALVLLFAAGLLFAGKESISGKLRFVTGALTSYIMLTGTVYLIILEPIYELYGSERLASSILHYITPPLMFLYWITCEKRRYSYREFIKWLSYPLIFMGWGLFRAFAYKDYLYPFFDLEKYGAFVSVYLLMVAIGFTCMILLIMFINNTYLRRG